MVTGSKMFLQRQNSRASSYRYSDNPCEEWWPKGDVQDDMQGCISLAGDRTSGAMH